MSPDELEQWLKGEASQESGWAKDDGSGESIGHERYAGVWIEGGRATDVAGSGRKIIDILRRNPSREPSHYAEDDLPHMRKVVGYVNRHLAQEEKAKRDPDSRSAKSLRNWGHVS